MGMDKNCDNCSNYGRPSYEWPCTACTSAYGSAPTKWEGMVPANADTVEVVRCKDCQKWHRHTMVDRERGHCHRYNLTKHESGFCDKGERRTDD